MDERRVWDTMHVSQDKESKKHQNDLSLRSNCPQWTTPSSTMLHEPLALVDVSHQRLDLSFHSASHRCTVRKYKPMVLHLLGRFHHLFPELLHFPVKIFACFMPQASSCTSKDCIDGCKMLDEGEIV